MSLDRPPTRPSLTGTRTLLGFESYLPNMKTLKVWGIYQNEALRSEVFVDQPRHSVDILPAGKKEFMVDGLLAKLGNGIVPLNFLHFSQQVSLYRLARGSHL